MTWCDMLAAVLNSLTKPSGMKKEYMQLIINDEKQHSSELTIPLHCMQVWFLKAKKEKVAKALVGGKDLVPMQ